MNNHSTNMKNFTFNSDLEEERNMITELVFKNSEEKRVKNRRGHYRTA